MGSGTRFPILFDEWYRHLARALLLGPAVSYLIDADADYRYPTPITDADLRYRPPNADADADDPGPRDCCHLGIRVLWIVCG